MLQHPQSQHVLIGSNATFSCKIRHATSNISWEEIFPSGSRKALLTQDEGNGIYIHESWTSAEQQYNSTLTIVVNCSNAQRWNGAIFRCYAPTDSGSLPSSNATLAIYKSLSKCCHEKFGLPGRGESITYGVWGMLHSSWENSQLIMLLWTVWTGMIEYYCAQGLKLIW